MKRALALSLLAHLLIACALVLSACGPFHQEGYSCVSPCQVRLYGSDDCQGFALAEARMLAAFGPYRPDMCQHIRHWSVSTGYTDLHENPWHAHGVEGKPRDGQTWVDFHGVQLQDVSDWKASAYLHEMGHVEDSPDVDYEHAGPSWKWKLAAEANQ
jgi:hypothetical protein